MAAESLVDERTVRRRISASLRIAARIEPSTMVHHDPQGRRHTVPQSRHVEARGMAPLILSRYTIVSALGKGLD